MEKYQSIKQKISKLALVTTIIIGGNFIIPASPTLAQSIKFEGDEIEIASDDDVERFFWLLDRSRFDDRDRRYYRRSWRHRRNYRGDWRYDHRYHRRYPRYDRRDWRYDHGDWRNNHRDWRYDHREWKRNRQKWKDLRDEVQDEWRDRNRRRRRRRRYDD